MDQLAPSFRPHRGRKSRRTGGMGRHGPTKIITRNKRDDPVFGFFIRPAYARFAVIEQYNEAHPLGELEKAAADEVFYRLLGKGNENGLDAATEDIYLSPRDLWAQNKAIHLSKQRQARIRANDDYTLGRGKRPRHPVPEEPFRFTLEPTDRALLDQDYLEQIVDVVRDNIIPFALEQGLLHTRESPKDGYSIQERWNREWARKENMQYIGQAMFKGEQTSFYVPETLLPDHCKGTVEREVPVNPVIVHGPPNI